MERSSANAVESLGGINSYDTGRDKFAAEHCMRYTSDAVALLVLITGIAYVALRYNTILKRMLH
jgi:hypothetical protein